MSNRHKHADIIHAWAEGAQIQRKNIHGEWIEDGKFTTFAHDCEYRIKPEKKPDVVYYYYLTSEKDLLKCNLKQHTEGHCLSATFDGETHELIKVELL
jgi:hypothetical protein